MGKGKNFSANRKRKDRNANDLYSTPSCLTRLFMDKFKSNLNSDDCILEPCYGKGAIYDVLCEYHNRNNILYSDIYDYVSETYIHKHDFLLAENTYQADNVNIDWIITNPPYVKANEFVFKCKEVAKKGFVLLLPLSYLQSYSRYETIFNVEDNYRLKEVYVYTRYPMFQLDIREDGKHETGMVTFAEFVWVKGYDGLPTIDWLDNNPYVVGSKKSKEIEFEDELF